MTVENFGLGRETAVTAGQDGGGISIREDKGQQPDKTCPLHSKVEK